jgi:hypothetical protein
VKSTGKDTGCVKERNFKIITPAKCEGQPHVKEALSDCTVMAAELFCGIEQMAPRVKSWWKR